jgi:hypothetical protein
MDNPNPIYYRDLIMPDDSITKLLSQLDELITKYDAAKSKIQGAAADIAKGMQNVSGATEEQRKTIQLATEQSEKLIAEYRDVTSAQWKATQAFAEASAAKKESAQIDKLITQIITSEEGSYNRLSAQYRLNKIRLNDMSAAQRKGTEEGRALEQETNAIYEEMKRLQEATGKHQLNVGNYADAVKGLKTELTSLIQQMAYLKSQGEQNSEEYRAMAERAGQLKDAMMDAQTEVKAMASDTRALDTVMGAASAASGGFAAYTGLTQLLGTSSDDAQEMQKKLGSAIAIVSGVTAIQNALQKESNLMTGIRIIQTKAATKAEQLDAAAKAKNTAATAGATAAQRIFNLVASANPYVLLAIALVTVVGALIAFASGASKAAKEQAELNKEMAAYLDYLDSVAKESVRANNETIQALENELEVAKARKASLSETRAIEDKIYNERVKAHGKLMGFYANELAQEDANRAKLKQLQELLYQLQAAQAAGRNKIRVDVDLDGEIEKVKIDDAIEAVQGQIDNYGRSVQIAVDLKTEGAEISKDRAIQLAQRRQEGQQIAKTELDVLRSTQDARLALIADSYKREMAILRENAERQIQDIKLRLKTESNLTRKARTELNEQMKLIMEKYYRDVQDLQNAYTARDLAARRETQDVEIALMEEGAEKQRFELRISYERQYEDLSNAIATQRNLTEKEIAEMYNRLLLLGDQYRKDLLKLEDQITADQLSVQADRIQLQLDAVREGSQDEVDLSIELLGKQREIELAQNAQLAEDMRQSEADINKKWDAVILKQTTELTKKRALMLLDAQQELAASEFSLLDKNERQKTQFQLQMEKERLQKILELDQAAGYKMTEVERKNIENTIAAIDKQTERLPYNNLYELLGIGLDQEQQGALNTAIDSIKEAVGSLVDSWNAAAEAAVNAANKQVDAAQKTLDAEIEARNAGYANEVETAQKELELAKKNQEAALKEKQKAQKAQSAIDSITQASSLVTASANIWSSLSGIPIVGPGLAITAIATMWGSFLAAKIKAAQVTAQTEQYGHGTVELLQGGSHASGNDIDLGTKPDGTRRRAEGGEYFAVINKRNSRRYGRLIPDVINAFNDGTFADKYQRANATMDGYAISLVGGSTDVSGLEKDVAAIREQGDRTQYVDGNGNIIFRYKNLTRKIYKN